MYPVAGARSPRAARIILRQRCRNVRGSFHGQAKSEPMGIFSVLRAIPFGFRVDLDARFSVLHPDVNLHPIRRTKIVRMENMMTVFTKLYLSPSYFVSAQTCFVL